MGGKSGWGEVGGAGALFVFLSLLLFAFARYFIKEEEEDEPGSRALQCKT